MHGEKENNRVWVTYDAIHKDSTTLAERILTISGNANGIATVAVARGGWFPTRIAGAYFEENGMRNEVFSVTASYHNAGTPNEYTSISRGLDTAGVATLMNLVFKDKFDVWVIEAICHTGRASKSVVDYLAQQLSRNGSAQAPRIHAGSMHVTSFDASPEAPWRMQKALIPDCYGRLITSPTKPHVEYPWEYSSLQAYNEKMKAMGGMVI